MNDDEKTLIKPGHVVQVNPKTHAGSYKSCFAVVTEAKGWGVQAKVMSPQEQGNDPIRIETRFQWKEIEIIGIKKFS